MKGILQDKNNKPIGKVALEREVDVLVDLGAFPAGQLSNARVFRYLRSEGEDRIYAETDLDFLNRGERLRVIPEKP